MHVKAVFANSAITLLCTTLDHAISNYQAKPIDQFIHQKEPYTLFMYIRSILIHPSTYSNSFQGVLDSKLPFHKWRLFTLCRSCSPHFVFTRLLTLRVLEETLFIETRVIAAGDRDFVFVDAVRPSTFDAKLARDGKRFV